MGIIRSRFCFSRRVDREIFLISRRREALLSLTTGKVCFKNPAGFLKAGRRRLILAT